MEIAQPDIFAIARRRHEAALKCEDKAAALFRAGKTAKQIARLMRVAVVTVRLWRRHYEKRTGEKLPRHLVLPPPPVRVVHADRGDGRSTEGRQRRAISDAELAQLPRCERCGLAGEHECMGSIEDYVRTGTSALGEAQRG